MLKLRFAYFDVNSIVCRRRKDFCVLSLKTRILPRVRNARLTAEMT